MFNWFNKISKNLLDFIPVDGMATFTQKVRVTPASLGEDAENSESNLLTFKSEDRTEPGVTVGLPASQGLQRS